MAKEYKKKKPFSIDNSPMIQETEDKVEQALQQTPQNDMSTASAQPTTQPSQQVVQPAQTAAQLVQTPQSAAQPQTAGVMASQEILGAYGVGQGTSSAASASLDGLMTARPAVPAHEEPMKNVQTKIPLSVYLHLNALKYSQGTRINIGDLVALAIKEFVERHPL